MSVDSLLTEFIATYMNNFYIHYMFSFMLSHYCKYLSFHSLFLFDYFKKVQNVFQVLSNYLRYYHIFKWKFILYLKVLNFKKIECANHFYNLCLIFDLYFYYFNCLKLY